MFILPNKITEDQTFSEEDVAFVNEIEQRMRIDYEDFLVEQKNKNDYITANFDDDGIASSLYVMENNSPSEGDIQSVDWLKAKAYYLEYLVLGQDLVIFQLEYEIHRLKLKEPLNTVLAAGVYRQELILLDKSAKVENSRKCTNVLTSSTSEKWLPFKNEYDAFVADGMKSAVALHKIGNKIEAAIKENPAQTVFKKRPDRTTIFRQLVQNRK